MADEFSLEDILEEYSGKTVAETPEIKPELGSLSQKIVPDTAEIPVVVPKMPVVESVPVKTHATEETIGLHVKLGVKAHGVEETVVPEVEKVSPVRDISVTQLIERAVEGIDEDREPQTETVKETMAEVSEEEAYEEQPKKKLGNTAIIEKIVKLKKQRAGIEDDEEETEVAPVNRPKPEEINMELTGKILPETSQIDVIKPVQEKKPELSDEELAKLRQKKIDQFVLKENAAQNTEDNADENNGDYNSFDETEEVAEEIEQLKNNLFIRFVVLLVCGFIASYISIANDFDLPIIGIFNRNTSPGGFAFTLTLLGLVGCFVAYNVIFSGIKNLFTLRADSDTISVLAITASVVSGIVLLTDEDLARGSNFHLYIAAAILSLLVNTLGKLLLMNRIERNFKYVSGDYDKYAVTMIEDEETALKFTNGAINEYPCLATMKKTEFVKDFLKNSYSADITDSYSRKFAPFMLIGSVLIAVLGALIDKNATGTTAALVSGLSILSGTLSLCSAVALMLVVNVPLARASKKYLQSSGVMLGYSSVDDFADTNSVLVGVEQLFPEGSVELVNLKTMSTTIIEECILLAGSLVCQAGSVLKPTFYKILKGKTEMLYPVESYIYEDGLGLSGWIENKRVLLGTRELMENHSIEGIPSVAKERDYAKGNLCIYLSISGIVSALFVVRAKGSANVSKWLKELEKQNMTVIIRSVDSFISLKFLSETFGVSADLFKLLPFRDYKEYDKQTSYVPKLSASMLCSGKFQSLAMLITGAKRIQMLSLVGITIQMSSAILGAVIALIMALLGSYSQLTASVVLCYNLVWIAVTLIAQQLRKV
ncbi:MAG: hypothetical protein E7509_01830 [Ruminococcus sp.]|nr:hypothetical protein [Ruminococcus sp.]